MGLADLVRADRLLERLRYQLTHSPEQQELSAVEVQLAELAGALRAVVAAMAPVRAEASEHGTTTASLHTREDDLERRLAQSTGGAKELAALTHELEVVRAARAASEDHELAQMLALEPLEEEERALRQAAEPLVARRTTLRAAVAAATQEREVAIEQVSEQRQDLARAVPPDVLAQYEQIRHRAGGAGAAFVEGGKCDACRLALSPLDLDHFARATGTFLCPECGRILLPC